MENQEFPERLVSVSSTTVKSGKKTVSFRCSNKEVTGDLTSSLLVPM